MYINQVANLIHDLAINPRFDCKLSGSSKGIRITSVIKLPKEINQNNHNVFITVDNYHGKDLWAIQLDNEKRYYFDKPNNELACDVPLYGDNKTIKLLGVNGEFSQVIEGLSANHTNFGHSSYLVVATLEENIVTIPDDTWLPNETEILAELKALRDRLDKLDKLIKELHG